ncbi:Nitroreductase [Streptomyces zhaozhouensis]|uniref:Nitroreductase n=1 Tax=Streptomyces zhaozhouensis TaxID=1300267 RepID=A0A286DW38_9ACTN|nr:nitroreductase family protein [Streptomyces zhaozhouensis]SOD62846.1 Nitroreductase [Streptomyces zhaozhouensis]
MSTDDERHELLEQRYGKGKAPEGVRWNDQIAGMLRHRSVRAYLPDPLPEGTLETLVAAAQSASTSSNLHQWSVVAVTDPELKAEIAATTRMHSVDRGNPQINEAPLLLLWVADLSRSHAIATEAGDSGDVLEQLDTFLVAATDAALAAQNATVAAESLGLGTVYIGAARNKARELAEMIGLPPLSFVSFGLVVGVPDPERPARIRPRPAQELVLHRERYDTSAWREAADDYEEEFRTFREDVGLGHKTWRESVLMVSSGVEAMDGRQNLGETVRARGFLAG